MLRVFLIVACVFTLSCSHEGRGRKVREATRPTLEGTRWMLQAIKGRPIISDGPAAFIELRPKDWSFIGNSGLNAISGTYQVNGDHAVRFTLGLSTQRAGAEASMVQERDLLHILAATETYRVNGRELRLLVDDQAAALFVAR